MDEHAGKIFGLPVWAVLLAGGGAAVVAILIFRNQGSSSSGGGATGYSAQGLAVMQNPDESATMALQNQQLSELATEFGAFGQQLTDQSNQIGQIGTDVNNGFSSVGTSLNAISGQVTGVSNQVDQLSQADTAHYNSLLTNISNYANALSAQLASGQAADVGLAQGLQADIIQLFYAVPNRYTTFLSPGIQPTTGPNFGG
jgi:hypothetical protein